MRARVRYAPQVHGGQLRSASRVPCDSVEVESTKGDAMKLQLTVRHGSVPDTVVDHVERKLHKLDRRLPDDVFVEVRLVRERNPAIPNDHIVEAEVHLPGAHLFAREAASTYETATDRVVEALERQIERRREKQIEEPRRRAS
jgi:putative sigma-54 modulation protein